jgi:hypothetical protein
MSKNYKHKSECILQCNGAETINKNEERLYNFFAAATLIYFRFMKFLRHTLLFCTIVLLCKQTNAQNRQNLKVTAEYGYNYTWENFGALAVVGSFPLKDYFISDIGIKAYTSNIYAFSCNARTIFPKKYGEWRIENKLLYRAFVRNKINEFSGGVLAGFRHNYINVGVGLSARLNSKFGEPSITNQQRYIIEPFNPLYFIECNMIKNSNLWNIGVRVANFDDFQIERPYQPIFTLTGKYSLKNKPLTFFSEATLKPSGVFHLSANFYEIRTQFGFKYKF